jgi:uncharacterized protein
MRQDDPAFLGRGWSFPPSFTRGPAGVEMVSGAEDITQSLRILLATSLGERIMVPDYGCALAPLLFGEVTVSYLTELQELVRVAIRDWEPRITLVSVTAVADAEEPGLVRVSVDYTIRATNTRSNFVYPFYVHEATIAPPLP